MPEMLILIKGKSRTPLDSQTLGISLPERSSSVVAHRGKGRFWIGVRKMPAKNISGDSPGSLWLFRRRLFQDMITVEVRMRADIPFPLVSKNNVGLGLIGEDPKQFCIESLREDPADNRDHRRHAGAAGDEPHSLCHDINPMAALVRTAHQHGVVHALVVQALRNDTGFVAFHSEIEETHSIR